MNKLLCILLILLIFCGCAAGPVPTVPVTSVPETTEPEATVPETTVPETTVPETTVPETTVPPTTLPPHSDLYLEDFDAEDILLYFNEVVLQMEYTDGTGDPTVVQKWLLPIQYRIFGDPTEEDLVVLESFFAELNQLPGFPGIREAGEEDFANLTLSFLGPEEFRADFSEVVNGEDAWGACQYWYYTDTNELYDARIGYRTDIDQVYRNSILLEEIVNALGITDTERRSDSIVYQYSNDNLELSKVDWLILKLLYHPDIQSGMNAEECRRIIESLYY